MIRATLVLLALTGCAQAEQGYAVQVTNGTAQPFASLSAYGTDGAGTPVEDNLGAALVAIAPGATGTLPLTGITACQEVWVVAQNDAGDTAAAAAVDLCQTSALSLQGMPK